MTLTIAEIISEALTPEMGDDFPAAATLAVKALMHFPDDQALQRGWFRHHLMNHYYSERQSMSRDRLLWLIEQQHAGPEDWSALEGKSYSRFRGGTLIGIETFNAIALNGHDHDWSERQGTREYLEDEGLIKDEANRKLTPPLRPVSWLWAEWWRRVSIDKAEASGIFQPQHLRPFVSNALELRSRGLKRRTHIKAGRGQTIVPADALRLPDEFERWAIDGAQEVHQWE